MTITTLGRVTYQYPPSYPNPGFPPSPAPRQSWWKNLPGWAKAVLVSTAAVLLLCVGLTTLGAIIGQPDQQRSNVGAAAGDEQRSPSPAATAATAATTQTQVVDPLPVLPASPGAAASPITPAAPVVEKRTVTETQSIPFKTTRTSDPTLPKGTTKVKTPGRAGVKTLTYEVTYTNGVQTGKKLVRQAVTRNPVTQVIRVGTKAARQCDPNYSGCVPIASDVDCAGGGGNGPAYVEGPVRVIGSDIYDLDSDNNGVGCED